MRAPIRSLLAAAGLAAFGVSSVASADNYSLISAPFGSGSYVLGGALEEIVRDNHPSIRVSHSESPGFAFNLNQLDRDPPLRKTMMVGTGRGVVDAAVRGQPPFEKELPPVKAIANYNLVGAWMVTFDDDIKTVADLRGRTVALGRKPQINWTIQPELLMRVGWELGDSVNIEYMGLTDATQALLDGRVDAAVIGGYFPLINNEMTMSPHTVEFMSANRDGMRHLPWGEEAVKRVVEETGMPLAPDTVPDDHVQQQDGPLEIYADTVSWAVHADFPEQAAYEITKLIIDNVEKFAEFHALGKLMTPEALAYGWEPDEFHPGALRAYQEAGILD
ncbi:MAG: TAXI family TRAP transporter solute-binding subunit [Aquisalimonadaceae bacterium]